MSLVKVMLKDKHPLKTEGDIQKMLDNVIKGKVDDWMWNKIIDRMYDLRDGEVLKENIRTIKAETLAQQ